MYWMIIGRCYTYSAKKIVSIMHKMSRETNKRRKFISLVNNQITISLVQKQTTTKTYTSVQCFSRLSYRLDHTDRQTDAT